MTKILSYFLIVSLSAASSDITYKPLVDQKFETCTSSHFEVEYKNKSFPLAYTFCSQGNIPNENIHSQIESSTKDVFKFVDHLKFSPQECLSNRELHIYDVSVETLNDKGRFDGWQKQNVGTEVIWALYDPMVTEPSVSSIMLTEHKDWNEILFAHELSHYWYDRFCINREWDKSAEQFALDFEEYLIKRKED